MNPRVALLQSHASRRFLVALGKTGLGVLLLAATLERSDAEPTAWVGHVKAPTGLPGTPGGYGPYHIGRGEAVPGANLNGMWTWSDSQFPDSLQAWWPVALPYGYTGGLTRSDTQRAWWALDYGNQASYSIPQGLKRTFGVVGVWHRDNGSASGPVGAKPAWSPLAGSYSAWMGMRAHGDLSFVDPITGNAFNEDVLAFNNAASSGPTGTLRRFPGYGSQMDQLLYRDINATGANITGMTVSFKFRCTMSASFDTAAATRTGWFQHDPFATSAGNFISSTLSGASAPRDSFMVYIGVPVNDAAGWLGTDGVTHPVNDPARRYFAETIRSVNGLYREIFARAGSDSGTVSVFIPGSVIATLSSTKLRLVFRAKTNRGSDDQTGGFVSYGRGAVQVDDVGIAMGGPTSILGDFESSSDIDNSISVNPLDAWKSTGKPPQPYLHVHQADDLIMEAPDPLDCRQADQVISAGNHDFFEYAPGGLDLGPAGKEAFQGIMSPTINLASGGVGVFNGQGIDAAVADATDDYYLRFDVYTGALDRPTTGLTITIGVQCYPVLSANGVATWSDIRLLNRSLTGPPKECRTVLEGLRGNGLIQTSNASGLPDSVRVLLGVESQVFASGAPFGSADGIYFDNVTFGFQDQYLTSPVFRQMDFYGSSQPRLYDTDWGALDLLGIPGPDTTELYFNLVVRKDSLSADDWVIRNTMLPAQFELEDTLHIRQFFSLAGVRSAPGPIPSLQYRYFVSAYPYATMPSPIVYNVAPLLDDVFDSEGANPDSIPLADSYPGVPPHPIGMAESGAPARIELEAKGMPSVEEKLYGGFPSAITRSLLWLQSRNGGIGLNKTAAQLIAELEEASGWSSTGRGSANVFKMLAAKLKVTNELKMYTKFAPSGGINVNFYGDIDTNPKGPAIHCGLPKFSFIKEERRNDEDVEVFIQYLDAAGQPNGKGHVMTVVDVKEDEKGNKQIYVQQDPHPGTNGDKDVVTPLTYVDPDGDQPARLEGIAANRVELVLSESPRNKGIRDFGNRFHWGSVASREPYKWTIGRHEKSLRLLWTCGRFSKTGPPIPHPGYDPIVFGGNFGDEFKIEYPDDPSVTDRQVVITDDNDKISSVEGNIQRHSPWAFHSLLELPTISYRIPYLAPAGADSFTILYMAVNLDLYLLHNRFGFLNGAWSVEQSLASLGLSVVDGRIPGLDGVYFATTPFVYDPDSETGFVPTDSTSWLNSATYPYPLEIAHEGRTGDPTVSVPPSSLPGRLSLLNHPNPFMRSTQFQFALPTPGRIRLKVFDVNGRLIRTLANAGYPAGSYSVPWDGEDAAGSRVRAGVYFARLETEREVVTCRAVLFEPGR